MYVCVCAAVTDSQIKEAVCNGATFKDLRTRLSVARKCCSCARAIHSLISDLNKYSNEPIENN